MVNVSQAGGDIVNLINMHKKAANAAFLVTFQNLIHLDEAEF